MTKREAWLSLATAWDNAKPDKNGEWCAAIGIWQDHGLCGSIFSLQLPMRVSEQMFAQMKKHWPKRIAVRTKEGVAWRWPFTKAGAKARAAFCRKMARLK